MAASVSSSLRRDKVLSRRDVEALIADGRTIVVVEGKVLKVDAWLKYHPGGDKAIMHMVGRDATDEVNAYVVQHCPRKALPQAHNRQTSFCRCPSSYARLPDWYHQGPVDQLSASHPRRSLSLKPSATREPRPLSGSRRRAGLVEPRKFWRAIPHLRPCRRYRPQTAQIETCAFSFVFNLLAGCRRDKHAHEGIAYRSQDETRD